MKKNNMETVHFSIGQNFGKTLTDIAQEHLLYNYNYNLAKKTIMENLMGITEEQALEVLFGISVLDVDVDTQELSLQPYNKTHKDFKQIHIKEWINNTLDVFRKDAGVIYKSIYSNSNLFQKSVQISIKLPELLKLELKNIDIDHIRYENENIDIMFTIVEQATKVLENFYKIQKCISQIILDTKKYKNKEYLKFEWCGEPEIISKLAYVYDNIIQGNHVIKEDDNSLLDNYLKAQKEITDSLRNGIKPVNHKDKKYSAGWISPNGDYYALNGEISNFLHNQIAEALYDVKIIPNTEKYENNCDLYLTENGWVKQHGNWILTDGYFEQYNKPITEEQRKVIYEIGQIHYGGKLDLGIKRLPISASLFQMIKNKMFKDKWFKL